MAYNIKEDRKTVGEIKKNSRGEFIRVDSIKGNDGNSIDIRLNFTAESGEVLPTKKGVRVNSEQSVDLVKYIIQAMDNDAREDLRSIMDELLDSSDDME